MIQTRFNQQFDRHKWRISQSSFPTTLLEWEENVKLVDAGVPQAIQSAICDGLLQFGTILYADSNPENAHRVMSRLVTWRWLKRTIIPIVSAKNHDDGVKAFDADGFDWTQAAQWIIVINNQSGNTPVTIKSMMTYIFKHWAIPKTWPADVIAIIQAGVDGDAAAISCKDAETLERVKTAISIRLN